MRILKGSLAAAGLIAALSFAPAALALGVTIDGAGNLFVDGTNDDDAIILVSEREEGERGARIEINGIDFGFFPMTERAGLVVRGYAGDDLLDLSGLNETAFAHAAFPDFAVVVRGDSGNDEIWGSHGNDELYGNDGDDLIRGGEGDDIVLGEAGNDSLHGGPGRDVIDGGLGFHDTLWGGGDRDKLGDPDGVMRANGGSGDDKIAIEFAADWVAPEDRPKAAARIIGGYHADTIEITITDAEKAKLFISGDEQNGYENEGDFLIFRGATEKANIEKVETTTFLP